ncbi:unnamed protein product [Coffea canephora]|uniref:Protein kinase domain-containing protein n=1 Tax=Coffea canephora TaxID=49390 RepID=A0A068TPF5_COFCA|nr:unnamed protein product [Coffea canephora]
MKQLHYNLSYLKVRFEEFKNEILLIAKLQHKNLVRLLGYCLEGEEKTLIYERFPNRIRNTSLTTSNHTEVMKDINAIRDHRRKVQKLLYLHEDTLLRIIHRDLKRSMLYQNSPSLDANIHICI